MRNSPSRPSRTCPVATSATAYPTVPPRLAARMAASASADILSRNAPRGAGRALTSGARAYPALPATDMAPAKRPRRVKFLLMGGLSGIGLKKCNHLLTQDNQIFRYDASQSPAARISLEDMSLIGTFTKTQAGASDFAKFCASRPRNRYCKYCRAAGDMRAEIR